MMSGYEAFSLYNSLKLHFNSDSYDYFKYNGKSNISIESFENRKDKWHFYKLSRRFTNKDQAQDFLVANFLADSNVWIGHLLTDESDATYRERQKVIQSLTYTFTNEIASVIEHNDPNASFKVHEGEYPTLFRKLLHNEVSVETICILNKILNFLPMWDKKITDTIHYPAISRKIKKYTPFIQFDTTKYKLILKKEIDENK